VVNLPLAWLAGCGWTDGYTDKSIHTLGQKKGVLLHFKIHTRLLIGFVPSQAFFLYFHKRIKREVLMYRLDLVLYTSNDKHDIIIIIIKFDASSVVSVPEQDTAKRAWLSFFLLWNAYNFDTFIHGYKSCNSNKTYKLA